MLDIFKTIMTSMLKKPATIAYPYKPKQNDELVRGHVEVDINVCIFCGICRRKCPTGAIDVVREEKSWAIQPFRCIQCNCCVEACPKGCLCMKNELTPASPVMTKEVFCDSRVPVDAADNKNG